MQERSLWISGPTRSGKTTRLVEQFCSWVETLGGEVLPVGGHPLSTPQESRNLPNPLFSKSRLNPKSNASAGLSAPGILVFAANGDNRIVLAERLESAAVPGQYPVRSTTPLGFFQDEVILFWPLLIRQLDLRAQFPIRLRSETEQELATRLWRQELDEGVLRAEGVSEYRLVRRTLDLLQLAAVSGTPTEDIKSILEQGFPAEQGSPQLWECMEQVLLRWRGWCLERGLLTYGIIAELYWRYLLPHPTYQLHLSRRYRAVLADDADEYPAIARDLFDFLLDRGILGVFTFNPDGGIRLGLNADPDYMAGLASRCQEITLLRRPVPSLADTLGEPMVDLVLNSLTYYSSSEMLSAAVQSIQTTSRGQLLRETARSIIEAVRAGEVYPHEVAVIAPGLDAIARYTLVEILTKAGIPVESLNDQRPLASSPTIRALLTLLAFIYPGLGRLVDRESVAEMLVMLSHRLSIGRQWLMSTTAGKSMSTTADEFTGTDAGKFRGINAGEFRGTDAGEFRGINAGDFRGINAGEFRGTDAGEFRGTDAGEFRGTDAGEFRGINAGEFRGINAGEFRGIDAGETPALQMEGEQLTIAIDPVRAGLLADRCYSPDINRPGLLPVTAFSRWDRIGYQAARAYEEIVQWIDEQRSQLEQRLLPSPVSALDRAIGRFLWNGSNLSYEQLSALRELIETAQHYWEVFARMNAESKTQNEEQTVYPQISQAVGQFIQLLRKGTVTANPYPIRRIGPGSQAVTLATIFQYRSSRRSHRWHFWLDASSPLWLSGGSATLFGAPLFLKDWSGRPWLQEDSLQADELRLKRILLDLLSRASDRLYLCHSDLAVNGQDQTGPLLPLVNAAVSLRLESFTG